MNPKSYGKILVLAICFSLASCHKILIGTSFASPSHLIPLASLAEELIARGHQITFVLPKKFSVIPLEAEQLILANAANPAAVFGSKADLTTWEMLSLFVSSSSDNCEYVSSDKQLKKHLNSVTYDLAIASTFNQECLLVTIRQYQKNIPFIMYHPGLPIARITEKVTGISVWDVAYNPGLQMDSSEFMDFRERFATIFLRLCVSTLFTVVEMPNNRILTKNLGPVHEDANNIQSNASFLFISSNFEFDYPVPMTPDTIMTGCLQCRPPKPLPKELKKIADGSNKFGMIIFSLGSFTSNEIFSLDRLEAFIEAFRQLPQTVIWHSDREMKNLPKNVIVKKWLPMQDILGKSIENKQDKNLEDHQSSFNVVLEFIRERVIGQKEVVQLGTLRHLYVQELKRCRFPNPDFRSDKLKTRLERHTINECIAITKVFSGDRGCIAYNLVYSTSISVAEAVTCAYRIGSKDKFEDVALHLRSVVQGMFNESTPLPWPPTADELDARASEEYLPTDLVKFLSTLILGEAEVEKSEKSQRLVLSTTFAFNIFGTTPLDICRAVTNGEWKLPKHILLCSTIRHLYRSNQLTNILHRLGHWESYYFGLEVETALAEAIDDVSSSLTPQITTGEDNEVFHVEWDNLNKITTNVHGSNVVNSTGGIMIQEVKPNTDIADKDRTLPLKQRNKTRCLGDGTPLKMPHFHIYGRVGPKFPTGAKFSPPIKNDKLYSECIREYRLWCLMRMATSSKETLLVPGFGGFISATGKKPSRKSTIDYFNPINHPFTEYSVIRELLKRSEDATLEFPEEYKKHVITPGPFHTVMNYIGMLTGHKCMGSGYSEILLEAGLVTSGCLKSGLKRKAHAKDLFSLKTVSEAMELLLIECFSEEEDINVTNPVALLNAAQNCSRESLDHALHDPSTAHISRVNHRLAIYKREDIPIFWSPKPYDPEQVWERNDEGVLEPVWSCGPVLPPTMIDLVEKTTEKMEQCDDDIEEEQSEQDSDYEELLSHPNTKVIISHGGFMTLQETFYHGVPYLGLPIHGSKSDRKRNIRLAEYRGIGRKLDFDNLTKEDITEKLHDLVNNKRYRENAKRISGYMKDQMFTPKERAVFYTEYAIRHHGAEHFKSYARNLTFVQINSIDVISFIMICAFLLLGIFYLIVKLTFKTSRCIFRFFFKSKKTKLQ
ncbi:UDP-glucuronosyltransferase 2B33 [Nymphon striatum]|nr:UDP-glucuronosyltransferase 2B33 [Nymphon striatum]